MPTIEEVFSHQSLLAERFNQIQADNGCLEVAVITDIKANLNARGSQMVIRRYLWQIAEELAEIANLPGTGDSTNESRKAEEAADVLHYFVELALILGLSVDWSHSKFDSGIHVPTLKDRFLKSWSGVPISWYTSTIELVCLAQVELAMASNHLKNKPWRTDSRETDWETFLFHLRSGLSHFVSLCVQLGIGYERLLDAYFKKCGINHDRIDSLP